MLIDIADPYNAALIGRADTPGYTNDVSVVGSLAYIAGGDDGLQMIDVSDPSKPSRIGNGISTSGFAEAISVVNNLLLYQC